MLCMKAVSYKKWRFSQVILVAIFAQIHLLHCAQVDDDVRLEDDWVPMDEQLDPAALEEVIREKQAHSSAVVLESVSYCHLLE